MKDSNYDLTEDKIDGAVGCVANAINDAIVALPNRPTVRFETVEDNKDCTHFECALRKWNQEKGRGALTEWLKILQIDEDRSKQEVPKDDTYKEEEEVELMPNNEQGVEQHEGDC